MADKKTLPGGFGLVGYILDSTDCASVGIENHSEFDFNHFGYILLPMQKYDQLLRVVLKAKQ